MALSYELYLERKKYHSMPCFTYFSIDATHSHGYGRMMNDSRKPNCKVVVNQDEELKLAIYAIANIKKGSELRFDYSDKSAYWRRVSNNYIQFNLRIKTAQGKWPLRSLFTCGLYSQVILCNNYVSPSKGETYCFCRFSYSSSSKFCPGRNLITLGPADFILGT